MAKSLTKKDFILSTTESLQKSAKTVLAGHGLNGQMLSLIAKRPDIIAKIVNFTTNTINWKKGKNALKKSKQFKISAYRNFNDFNKKGELDVQKFVSQLPPKDAETFSTKNNCIVMLCLHEKQVDEENLENEVANSKSQFLPFEKAVSSQYKLPQGFYIVISFAESLILTKAMAKAEREKNKNIRLAERQTKIANVKKNFVNKQKSKLANLGKEIGTLNNQLQVAKSNQQNLAGALQQFGINSGKINDIKTGKKAYDENIKNELLKLDDNENLALQNARQLWRSGYEKDAMAEIRKIKSADKSVVSQYVKLDGAIDSNSKIKSNINTTKSTIQDVKNLISAQRKSLRGGELTELMKKKAKAEIDRLKRVKAVEETKLANAEKLLNNKSLNVKNVSNKIANKIETLTNQGKTIETATAIALQQMNVAQRTKQQILANIGQQISQQNLGVKQQLPQQVAKQIVAQAVAQSITDSDIKVQQNKTKTPLEIKKSKAERARKTKAVTKAQQVVTKPQQVAPISVPKAKRGRPRKVVNIAQQNAVKPQNNNVVGSKKTTPLTIKKNKAEKARKIKAQQLANKVQQVATKPQQVAPISAPKAKRGRPRKVITQQVRPQQVRPQQVGLTPLQIKKNKAEKVTKNQVKKQVIAPQVRPQQVRVPQQQVTPMMPKAKRGRPRKVANVAPQVAKTNNVKTTDRAKLRSQAFQNNAPKVNSVKQQQLVKNQQKAQKFEMDLMGGDLLKEVLGFI